MSHCAVVYCVCNSATKDKIVPLENPIILDDSGSVLDGLDTKLFSLPSIPSPTTSSPSEIEDVQRVRGIWIHRMGRGDKLPKNQKNIYICSRHFGKESYDPLVPLRQGLGSFLEVARKSPKVRLLRANAVPTLNLPKWELPVETGRSLRQIKKNKQEVLNQALISR